MSFLQELTDIQAANAIQCDYQKTLALLRALKAGTVTINEFTMTDDGWTYQQAAPEAVEQPEEAA